jgi:RNA polymerase sigma-70 factor (ECF subfamily)
MADSTEGSDAAAVEQTLAGDQDAFRVLVERHSRSLFGLAFRMSRNEQDAEEIVQDTFVRAYRKLGQFESRANFKTWLYRITVNCALDRMRKRRTEEEHREIPKAVSEETERHEWENRAHEGPAPDRLMLSVELKEQIEQALRTLSAAERAAFVMRHWEGCGIDEIGRALNVRQNAAKNTVFRAVQKLRRLLEPYVTPSGARALNRALGAAPGSEP